MVHRLPLQNTDDASTGVIWPFPRFENSSYPAEPSELSASVPVQIVCPQVYRILSGGILKTQNGTFASPAQGECADQALGQGYNLHVLLLFHNRGHVLLLPAFHLKKRDVILAPSQWNFYSLRCFDLLHCHRATSETHQGWKARPGQEEPQFHLLCQFIRLECLHFRRCYYLRHQI